MALRHEEILTRIMMEWTREKRGRLFKNNNGKAWRGRITDERIINGQRTLELFGAIMIKYGLFPGSSDLVGWELVEYIDVNHQPVSVPVFCAVEVKTLKDQVREPQVNWLNAVTRMGGRAYLAREAGEGYEITEWTA